MDAICKIKNYKTLALVFMDAKLKMKF